MKHLLGLIVLLSSCWAQAQSQNYIDPSGREWMRIDQTFAFAGSLTSACNPHCSGVVTQYDYDVRTNIMRNPRQISLQGWTLANKGEAEALMATTALTTLGLSQMFVTTYSYYEATYALTSSREEASNSNYIAWQSFGHAMVSFSYDQGFLVGISSLPAGVRLGALLYRSSAPVGCEYNGQSIANGGTVQAFKASSVAYGQVCQSEVRTCNNGVMSGSFTASSCRVLPAASCSFNGQTIPHLGIASGYSVSAAPKGAKCDSYKVSRQCVNGVLNTASLFATCTNPVVVQPPKQECKVDRKGRLKCD